MTRLLLLLLLVMLPLQWVSAATERYQPHAGEAVLAAHEAGPETPQAGDDHGPGEHDCPQCHVLCLKCLFTFSLALPLLPAEHFLRGDKPAPILPPQSGPDRPPRLSA